MSTQQAQIKINLPLTLKKNFEKKVNKVGVTMSFFIKHLMLRALEEKYPVFYASKSVEKAYKKAKEDEKNGRLIWVDNADEYFKNLNKP